MVVVRHTARMVDGLRVLSGGSGEPLLLLLHGLGATADVWSAWEPLLASSWPGRWVAPDLPGHGGSAPLLRPSSSDRSAPPDRSGHGASAPDAYSFGALAAPDAYSFGALAAAAAALAAGTPTVVLGHSLGGVLGLELAGRSYGVPVTGVVALGIKVVWSPEDLDRARALAARPPQLFPTRAEAVQRHLRLAGLTGLVDPDDLVAAAGVAEQDGGWRPALDPAAFGVGAPDMPALLAACAAPVVLARGEHDAMVTADQLAALDPAAVTLPGLGHNAHVEDPAAVLALLPT